jgi:hypothetical protein
LVAPVKPLVLAAINGRFHAERPTDATWQVARQIDLTQAGAHGFVLRFSYLAEGPHCETRAASASYVIVFMGLSIFGDCFGFS